jgi:hypothetical protein
MDILGDRKFVELPGSRTHELPPLLVRMSPDVKRLDKVMNMAADIIESEEVVPLAPVADPAIDAELDRRKMDLAINLVEHYLAVASWWQWGDSVLEWIRQCETTFETRSDLRPLLRADVWPHAGRSSFVTLLIDKSIKTEGVPLEKAVGVRLTFRHLPPIGCFSNQSLFYLNDKLASTAYETWARMTPDPVSCLPPERFTFDVVNMSLD